MPKTYPEELAEWVKGREAKKPRQDKHVVAFLAVKSDVQAALDAGYAMKTIWEHMKETGECGAGNAAVHPTQQAVPWVTRR